MATIEERKVAAIVGAAVADAAAQPLHWNYNREKLSLLLEGKEEVEFWEPSHNPFYLIPTGRHSCYGDQAHVILQSLVNCKDLSREHYKMFGPGSEYDNAQINNYKTKEDPGIKLPINGPWKHMSIKEFLKNYEAGKSETGSEADDQIDCVAKLVPLVALYAGQPGLLDKAEEVIRLTQQSEIAVAVGLAAARILELYILKGGDPDAVNTVVTELSVPTRINPQDLDKAVAGFLRQSACHGLLSGKDYVQAVRMTIRAGGCNSSRAGFIGACFAAKNGMDSIPESWRERTIGYEELLRLAVELCQIQL